jgi:hypothetical protein
MSKPDDAVSILVNEPREVPTLSVIFGYGPMIPFAGGAILAWVLPEPWRTIFFDLTVFWAVGICTFLAGVRRGVSFRTMGGPKLSQILTMLWLFCAGMIALLLWSVAWGRSAVTLLAVAYASIAILDPIAARNGEAPLFFAKLRPIQMIIPVVSLLAIIAVTPHSG